MAGLSGRVRSLERRTGVGTACAGCGGAGLPACELVIDGHSATGRHGGCRRCGKVSVLNQTVIEVDRGQDDPAEEGTPCA